MTQLSQILSLLLLICWSNEVASTGGPSMVHVGEDALLTCVVMTPYNNDTVLWRKGPHEILSAGMNRVTGDKRISVLHDDCKYDQPGKECPPRHLHPSAVKTLKTFLSLIYGSDYFGNNRFSLSVTSFWHWWHEHRIPAYDTVDKAG
uniref:Ig-like domain-containing protein n=1 Tax=Anopheles culicifacies TaxID=139723 RepID=A0A182MDV5_9DIPT